MNKNVIKQKKALNILCLVVGILSVLGLAGGIVMIVFGAKNLSNHYSTLEIIENLIKNDNSLVAGWLLTVFGAILVIVSMVFLIWSIFWGLAGMGSKYADGNVADENYLKDKEKSNVNKCPNCGAEIVEGTEFCGKCGHSLKNERICPHCNAKNDNQTAYCVSCGKKL